MVSKATLAGDSELYRYMLDISVRDNPVLLTANALSEAAVKLSMQSLPEALNLLQWLVLTFKAKHILEIGTFTGLSALAMALVSGEVQITCLDASKEFSKVANHIWQKFSVSSQIDLRVDDAKLTCEALLIEHRKPFYDLVFIDANKSDYVTYYEYALRLIKQGGIIVIDNVFLKGNVLDKDNLQASTEGIRAINQHVFNDNRVAITTLPLADGITLATKI
jgi:predicted O-methyltransferase YrrM